MTAHQTDQATILTPFGILLLPQLHKVLIDQTNHMEPVSHNDCIAKALVGDLTAEISGRMARIL